MVRRFITQGAEVMVPWAAAQMPFGPGFEFPEGSNAIGVADGDELLAVAVYHDYYPRFRSISMSIATTSPRWASKQVIGRLLAFPFIELGCERITTWQPANHPSARHLVDRVGFVEEGRLRKGFGDQDTVILGLLKSEAERWLRHVPCGLIAPTPPKERAHGQTQVSTCT